jgi:hypothetical protein
LSLQVLRLVFSCLQNAPASDTWDLSSLLVNGSLVSQATVIAVLSVMYSNLGVLNYEMDRSAGQYSLQALLDMLLFADAVGCSKAVLAQLAGQLGSTVRAELDITLTEGETGSSSNGGTTEAAEQNGSTTSSELYRLQLNHMYSIDAPPPTDDIGGYVFNTRLGKHRLEVDRVTLQQAEQLQQQVSQQLEVLLFVGFKLDLQQLLQPALRFLRACSVSLLPDISAYPQRIFSQRLLAAAGCASGVELLSRSCMQQPLGSGFGIDTVFRDVVYDTADDSEEKRSVSFTGTLSQDLYAFAKGNRLHAVFSSSGYLTLRYASDAQEADSDGDDDDDTTYDFGVVLGPVRSFQLA